MRYIHIRRRDDNWKVKATGGITIEYELEDGILTYSAAFCSPKDHYCKKIGREEAAAGKKFQLPFIGDLCDISKLFVVMAQCGALGFPAPSWYRSRHQRSYLQPV
jgi:hypothetical protein